MDFAQVRLNVTADIEGATAPAGIGVYDLTSGVSCEAGTCGGFAYGTPIKLRASPIGGHRFIGWSGDRSCTGSELELVVDRLTDDLYCVANYLRRTQVSGVIGGVPAGTSSGVIASSNNVTAVCEDASCEVDLGTEVRLLAPQRWGERFGSWSGADCGTSDSLDTVVVAQERDLVCTANYIGRYTVSGQSLGTKASIAVTSTTPGAVCEPTSCLVDGGGNAVLEAPKVTGFRFAGWSGTSACTGENPQLIIDPVSSPQRCTATYTARVRVRGSTNGAEPPPPVVALSLDAQADCSGASCEIDVGGSAILIASSAPGYRLTGWTGETCEDQTSSGIELDDVAEDVSCVAQYRLGIAVSGVVVGADGQVKASSTTAGAECIEDRCVLDAGGDATLEAPTIAGSRFLGWTGDAACTGAEPTLRFRGVMASLTCIANYAPRFEVSGESTPSGGGSVLASSATGESDCGEGTCRVPEGGEVTLEARANMGYRFAGWSGGGACTSATDSVRIADVRGNHRCRANFVATITVMGAARPEGTGSVRLSSDLGAASCTGSVCSVDRGAVVGASAVPNDGYDFAGWSDCSTSRDPIITLRDLMADTVCTANFAPRRFTINGTVTPPGAGSVMASSASAGANCNAGSCSVGYDSAVRLVATPAPGFAFASWTGCGDSTNADFTIAPVRMGQNCVASFTRVGLTVTFGAGAGGGVEVVASADGAACAGGSCSFPYDAGSVTLRAAPAPGFAFTAWSDCSSSTDPTLVIAQLTQNAHCQANFSAQRGAVTGVIGESSPPDSGSIAASSSSPNASCSGAACTVDFNGTVNLTALARPGFRFAGWTGCTTSGSAEISVADVRGSVICTATFERDRFRVRSSATPSNGGAVAVTSSASGALCSDGSCLLAQGDTVTLTAVPATGFGFMTWSGDGCPSSSNASHTFAVAGEVECTATFAMLPPVMVGLSAGSGGSISVMAPSGCAAPACAVPFGATLEATATADANYEFGGWTGTDCTSTGAQLRIASVTTPLACSATFVRRYVISARVSDGQASLGAVQVGTSAGPCPNQTCTVREGTMVYVTPQAGPGATFNGWNEPPCNQLVGATGASFRAMEDLSCTATFSAASPIPTPDAGVPMPGPRLFPASPRPLDLPVLGVAPQDAGLPVPP